MTVVERIRPARDAVGPENGAVSLELSELLRWGASMCGVFEAKKQSFLRKFLRQANAAGAKDTQPLV
jgi:hypothetical protein